MTNQNKLREPDGWINLPETKTLLVRERRNILLKNGFEKLPNMPKTILLRELKEWWVFDGEPIRWSLSEENPVWNLYAFPIWSTDIYEVFCKSPPPHTNIITSKKVVTDNILNQAA